jgi:hypothetical protein
VPQPHGGSLLPGGTGAGGRPIEKWRQACREALERSDGLGFLERVIRGDERELQDVTDKGEQVMRPPRIRDRLYAVQLLAEHGHGKPPQDLHIDDPKARPTGEVLMARVMELLPRVINILPIDRQEIARLIKQRQEIEAVVNGEEVKDHQNGNGNGTRR